MVYLTRIEHFNAAHKLYNPDWDQATNEGVFGKCANENWHGHNYDLHVTIRGEAVKGTGFLFDVKKLSVLVRETVIEKLDHLKAQINTSALKTKLIETKNAHLEASAKALTREYEAGKADLAMVLKAKRDVLSARIALAQERAKHIALIAEFNHYIVGDAL